MTSPSVHPLTPNIIKSESAYQEAVKIFPGGVNSPVRAFRSVGGTPLFIQKAKGPFLWDIDNNRYIDFVGSWGPMLRGHAYQPVVRAIQKAAKSGTSFGAPTLGESTLASLVQKCFPSMKMLRFVSSGTEATMSAVRLARAHTGKKRIIMFGGCYHGHSDPFLVQAGSGSLSFGVSSSPGVPKETSELTLIGQYNDTKHFLKLVRKWKNEIACVIVEPVAGNMGLVLPQQDFLHTLQTVCKEIGALLIFDEVITGFRISIGGAQKHYQIQPDITTLGKILGGGLPIGAYGGNYDVMKLVSPLGNVYQAGTLSGNPVAVQSGIALIRSLIEDSPYERMSFIMEELTTGMQENLQKSGIPHVFSYLSSLFCTFFTNQKTIHTLEDVKTIDQNLYAKYFHEHLKLGVYLPPSPFEVCFLSESHTRSVIQKFLNIHRKVLTKIC